MNARTETVAENPAFCAAFRRRLCLVPATGYYEWRTGEKGKQPLRFVLKDGNLFGFAGLWKVWLQGDEHIERFTIIVTEPNDLARLIHERMPVIVTPEHYDAWLTAMGSAIPKALLEDPYPAAKIRSTL